MNLKEAIESGRPFRRPYWGKDTYWAVDVDGYFCQAAGGNLLGLGVSSADDVCAEDWEVKDPAVTITRAQFQAAVDWCLPDIPENSFNQVIRNNMGVVAHRLGLD